MLARHHPRHWTSPVALVVLTALLLPSCIQYRHYTQTDTPISRAGETPEQPLPLRYRLTDFEVETSSTTSLGGKLAFGALAGQRVRWRDDAPADIRRAYLELHRSQGWMGSETLSDAEADVRTATDVDVKENTEVWIPGVLLYTLATTLGTAAGAGIGIAVDDSGFGLSGLLTGAMIGLLAGAVGGSFIPSYRATVDVKTRTRMESTARRGGVGGTFYEKTQDTHRAELYSTWSSGEDPRSAFVSGVVALNQREVLDHLRETGPAMLRALVNPADGESGLKPLPQGEESGMEPLPQGEDGEPVKVFVADVAVDAKGLEELGPVLASEIQVALQGAGSFQALTLENLEAQLRKEKKKALLSCADDGCVQRIIENFGIPDTIFGRVKTLGTERLHLTLTWTRGGDVIHAVTAVSAWDAAALLQAMRDLTARLAAAVASQGGE
ncbi:MAG: hypothetical protein ABIK09_08685 [Pseudomonadota bacterium]